MKPKASLLVTANRFEILAYSGGKIFTQGETPIVIDLATIELRQDMVITINGSLEIHDVLGQCRKEMNDGSTLTASGIVTTDSDNRRLAMVIREPSKWRATLMGRPAGKVNVYANQPIFVNGLVQYGPFQLMKHVECQYITLSRTGGDPGSLLSFKSGPVAEAHANRMALLARYRTSNMLRAAQLDSNHKAPQVTHGKRTGPSRP